MRLLKPPIHQDLQPISLGIDLGGRRIAWSVASELELLDVQHYEAAASLHRSDALNECSQQLIAAIDGYDITKVFIEEPYIGRGTRSSLQLAQMGGAVLAAFAAHTTLRPELIPVMTWKKRVCGRGDLDKEGIIAWLETHHETWLDRCRYTSPTGLARINQDKVDAICISRMAFSGPDDGLERRAVRRGRSKSVVHGVVRPVA